MPTSSPTAGGVLQAYEMAYTEPNEQEGDVMRRILAMILTLSLMLIPVQAVEVAAPSALLMEKSTGQILFEQNPDEQLRPASVTKIMTLLLIMEALDSGQISWDDTITASADAVAKGGSQVYLKEGETMSVDEMLKSIVVSSANDCATAMAEAVAGSESAFVEKMNAKAKELGMKNTHFVNCTGLDDGEEGAQHLSTARDIAIMSRELLGHEEIKNYTTIWMDTVRDGAFGLSNTNKLIRFYNGATGLKTGYTSAAGHCLSASAMRDDMELIAVVLHCSSSTERFDSAKTLLDYGFATYALAKPEPETPLPPVEIQLGCSDSVQPILLQSQPLLVEKGEKANLTTAVELAETVEAPVVKGQVLGKMTVQNGSKTLTTVDIVAPKDVPRLTWFQLAGEILSKMAFCV